MREVLTAAKARQIAAWRTEQVHLAGEVPANPEMPYNSLSCDSGLPGDYLMTADHGSRSFRLAVQSVGTDADECAFAIEKADAAFLDQALTVAGFKVSKARLEIAGSPRRDLDAGGLMVALSTYTFTAIQED